MFCEVERAYIEDGFNLYGLRACVSNFSDCLDLILDRIGPDDSDDSHLTQSACTLYGLIHARYIVTAHGLDSMYNKYAAKDFGSCPLVQCNGHPVLPLGLRDEIGIDTVKIFCPKCQCAYQPPPLRSTRSSGHHSSTVSGGGGAVDGAAFGTTFPHLFLLTFNNLVPDPLPADSAYIPRVFGFRVHQSSGCVVGSSGRGQSGVTTLTASALRSSSGGRRGVGANNVDSFTSQRVVVKNVAAAAAAAAEDVNAGERNAVGTNGQDAKDRTGTEVEIKKKKSDVVGGGAANAEEDGKDKKSGDAASKGGSKKGSVNGDGKEDTKADGGGGGGGEGSSSKRKGKEGDTSGVSNNENGGSSKSRSSKRQKRQAGSEVT
ncbi:hypothetical protein ACHAWO_013604 [Cyclotella atomus]|uniref:Casein kinase II subunit beta n=1 Tax=Cyclotella atomus TaxID=382360 RepID=A0ABD3PT40_9STRA